jgi:hypothetical protein
MSVLTAREGSIFACLTDTIVAPAPPLPAVADTDAVAAFDVWLARAPRAHRLALRGLLYAAEAGPRIAGEGGRLRRLDAARRLAFLERVQRARVPGARGLVEAVRGIAALCYYGDAGVMRTLGYDPVVPAAR